MKHYELTCLISSKISEEEAKKIQEKTTSFIQENGGILIHEKSPEVKRLAYPVQKEPVAFLIIMEFQLAAEKIAPLEKNLKSEKEILRYLLVIKPALKKTKAIRSIKRAKAEKPTEERKVELKEIEKKLDELLEK